MYKHLLIILILFIVACGNNNNNKSNESGGSALFSSGTEPVEETSFYKRLEGTVAGKNVIVHISKFRDVILANYYYTDHGQPIKLYFIRDTVLGGDSIAFMEDPVTIKYDESKENRWHLVFTSGGAKGRWMSADNKTAHSINLKENYPGGSHMFNVVGYRDSLTEQVRNDTVMAISQGMLLEPADAAFAGNWFRNSLLENIWGDDSQTNMTLPRLLEKSIKSFISDYKTEVDSVRSFLGNSGDSGTVHTLNYVNLIDANLMYNDNNFIVMDVGTYAYTGGAHGLSGSSMICYDVSQKRSLNLSDIITVDSLALQKIVEKNFRATRDLKPNERLDKILFENKLTLSDNFYFTNKGLGFVYQPYEAAAYVYGIINVFVPFTDLAPYVQPAFAQRMGLQ